MACSRFEYVKLFESHDRLLPGCWAVIRLDGRCFTSFAKKHSFRKPNDERALNLSNAAAKQVLKTFDNHLVLAYGQSDEYSFVLKRESNLFSRRESKILSTVVSMFTSVYVLMWSKFMDVELQEPPTFDGRIVLYPLTCHLRDYLSWRQADTHVNNLFNTAFWALVDQDGKSLKEAEKLLKGTNSKEKNELLFSQFGINYNNEPQMFRKGSLIIRRPGNEGYEFPKRRRVDQPSNEDHKGTTYLVDMQKDLAPSDDDYHVLHTDIIKDDFWKQHHYLLWPPDDSPPRIRKT
ncbi:putative tRNA(His) guanylyltransferase [Gracilariopsis chorda]|uniref:tRNA(His) guanylyltransferase n=1 Tax=Gracilariopsis chorda TaxID=448386 RepID=A0A2V3IGQ6_9FLOR|nr:putative tRNA(His) guanylyltransferase [Gracilariopsis chorda]|eukprot:PXF41275.1 putative tRNA(His) guanylyltransferase [Gracilariopsis chorda]